MQALEIQGSPRCPFSWWLIVTLPLSIIAVFAYNSLSEFRLLHSQMVTIKRAGDRMFLTSHPKSFPVLRKSCTIQLRQWAEQGTGVVLSFYTGHSSFALLSKSKESQRKETKKIWVWGEGEWERERVTINDMPHSEGIISFWRTIDCYLIFIKSCKASAMPAVKACWSHLACQINWNKNRHITFYQWTFSFLCPLALMYTDLDHYDHFWGNINFLKYTWFIMLASFRCTKCIQLYMYICRYRYMYVCIYMYMCIYIYVYVYIYSFSYYFTLKVITKY